MHQVRQAHLVGPSGCRFQLLADLGVVLLLLAVGLEVDLLRIRSEQRGLVAAAPLQTVATTVLAGAVLVAAGLPPPDATTHIPRARPAFVNVSQRS